MDSRGAPGQTSPKTHVRHQITSLMNEEPAFGVDTSELPDTNHALHPPSPPDIKRPRRVGVFSHWLEACADKDGHNPQLQPLPHWRHLPQEGNFFNSTTPVAICPGTTGGQVACYVGDYKMTRGGKDHTVLLALDHHSA